MLYLLIIAAYAELYTAIYTSKYDFKNNCEIVKSCFENKISQL